MTGGQKVDGMCARHTHTHTHSLPKGGNMESRERPPEAIVRHMALEKSLAASMHHLVCGVAIPNSNSKR